MKKISIWFLVLIIGALQTCSEGSIVSYTLDITSGGADTSGGYTGQGMGHISFSGMFNLTINTATGHADFGDISTSPHFSYPGAFDWDSLEGTYNLGNIYLSSPSLPGVPDNYLSGTFNGSAVVLQGIVRDTAYDGYQFDCTINAMVVPEPATLLLLGLGAVMLRIKR
jgi:hypothetical protein